MVAAADVVVAVVFIALIFYCCFSRLFLIGFLVGFFKFYFLIQLFFIILVVFKN